MELSRLSPNELFSAILKRFPTAWEERYWGNELKHLPIEDIIRRLMGGNEHKDLVKSNGLMFKPAGHFYSPIVDTTFVLERKSSIFSKNKDIDGIDINESYQKEFVQFLESVEVNLPFRDAQSPEHRYFYDNNAFVWGDGAVYAAMLMRHRPNKIIEIGSGYSSALALDVIDRIDGYCPNVKLFDPYPELVKSILANYPSENVSIDGKFIQDVPLEDLSDLKAGDFYFMDTTHVVKTGSDVLYHFEEVLPRLKSGVIVHIHDIFWPFEYPMSWVVDDKLSWNELYYFRAFMTHNPQYEILFFNDFMRKNNSNLFRSSSVFLRNSGASIWLRKK
nr:class I SAM-dependent methyltransferase [Sphingomonas populi]